MTIRRQCLGKGGLWVLALGWVLGLWEASLEVSAAGLIRGPYLQTGTPTSITICWRTDVPTESRVRYQTEGGDLITVQEEALVTEHAVVLSELQADTLYHYAIGSATEIWAEGDDYHFRTAPPVGSAKPFRIWVLGDFGYTNQNALPVRDAYYEFAGDRDTDLWLMLGDNAYHGGSDSVWQVSVFDTYADLLRRTVVWSTIGNQETGGSSTLSPTRPYLDVFHFPTQGEAGGVASGTEQYYSFDYANVHFICLDSMSSVRTTGAPMLNWLESDLASVTSQWTIAFWHHPPYSKGPRDSDTQTEQIEMRNHAVRMLESYGVDLVLAGHSHVYERSYLIDGHYGLSATLTPDMIIDGGNGRVNGDGPYHKGTLGAAAHQGAVYIVAGSGSNLGGGALNHPVMCRSLSNLGSVVLDIHANRLEAKFIRENGATNDYFTMIKGGTAPRLEIPEVTTETITLRWHSVADRTYEVKQAAEPDAETWEDLSGPVIAPGTVTSWTEARPATEEKRYYRVLSRED